MAQIPQVQYQGQNERVAFAPKDDGSAVPALAAELERQQAGFRRVAELDLANSAAFNRMESANDEMATAFANQNWRALTAFSETLAKTVVDETKRKSERDMEEGLMLAYTDGMDPAETMAFDIAEGYLKNTDDEIQAVGDKAQASGAPFMGVQKLRELSGWKQYGYAMGIAQNSPAAYAQFIQQATANIPPGATSAEKAVYLSNARAQFMKQSGMMGLNPALLNKYAFPGMREADSIMLNKWRKMDEDAAKEELVAEAENVLRADPTNNFGKAIDTLTRSGMTRGQARKELLKLIDDPDEIDAIANTLSWDGKKTWGELYGGEFERARRDAIKREGDNYNTDLAETHLEARQWLDSVIEQWEQNPPSEEEIEGTLHKLEDDFQGYTDPRLERWRGRSTDAESKAYYTEQFQQLDRAGLLTEAMLDDPAVPYSVRQSFLPRAQALDKARKDTPEFKQFNKQIEEDLKRHSDYQSMSPGAPGLELAVAKAQAKFQKDMMAAVSSGTMSPEQAAQNAYANFQRDLQASAEGNPAGLYFVDSKDGFKNVMPKGFSNNWIQHKAKIDNVLSAGVTTLDSHALIPLPTLQDALKNINNPSYQYPPIATYISNRFGGKISPWEVLNRQSIARGLGPFTPNPLLQKQTAGMSPEMVRLLAYKPSYNRVARAYASTGNFDPSRIPNGYGSVVLKAAQTYGVDPAILAGIIETESSWTNHQTPNKAGAVGIAQIIPKWHPTANPTNAIDSINYAAKYLRELTDQLGDPMEAIYAYNSGPGAIRQSAENRAYQPKVLRAAAKYGYNPGGGSPWRNPAFMSPRLAYVTGNIGPTSTGPHLDVKRTDRSNFNATDLDRYVVVDDPEYGRVPLSKVGTSDGQAEHRARGSHGIDYRTASGSKVYLKGGAKVVGSVRTEHGDKLTIQLPNGKQYTFLHGRSA